MDTPWWRDGLWRQFGAAIDTLDAALAACPEDRWTMPLWVVPASSPFPPRFAEYWYVGYHAIVWLDLYFAGVPESDFAPPAPFLRGELDSAETTPPVPYGKDQLRGYLAAVRRRCHDTLTTLTDEDARRPVTYPWIAEQPFTWVELQLYSMRHVQEHAAQLSLALGQQALLGDAPGWIPHATGAGGDA